MKLWSAFLIFFMLASAFGPINVICQSAPLVMNLGGISLSTSVIDVSCNGYPDGEASVVASGGLIPYSYYWSANTGSQVAATATGLVAGTYSVTVFDAG